MCKGCNEEKVRKVFLDDLPKWENGIYKGKTNWKESVGHSIRFSYEGLHDTLMIVKYKYPYVWAKYKDYTPYKIHISSFKKGAIKGAIINEIYKFNKDCRNNVWIDLSELPLNGDGIEWDKSVGISLYFQYEDIKGNIKIVDYIKQNQTLVIQYLNKDVFKIKISNFTYGKLGSYLGKYTDDFKIEIGQTFKDDKRDIVIIDRKYTQIKGIRYKTYRYKCNKCGFECGEHYNCKSGEFEHEYWTQESGLIRGNGCSCCCTSSQIVVPEINSIVANKETHWMIPYFQGGYDEAKKYTSKSEKSVYPICPDCGRVKNKQMQICNMYNSHAIGCSCSDGKKYPEKFMTNVLEQINIEYITEYKAGWCKYKLKNKTKTGRYDFYIPFKNLVIETDGKQHKIDTTWSTKEEQIQNDKYKDKLAKEHGVKVIRIDCEFSQLDFIKNNILNSELNNMFDLSNIDWNKCEEFALSNLCKKACEIKRDNPEMTTTEIGKIIKRNRNIVAGYLKKGSKLNWCHYNAKEEIERNNSNKRRGIINCKTVEIFKEGISLGIFESASELERKSEELFNIKLIHGSISAVARGIRNTHKGFTFRYIEFGKIN